MTKGFRLTPLAKDDLSGIWHYTNEVWEEAQADKYVTEIYNRFSWLAERPNIGKHRPDICEGYHCFRQGSHLLFYLISEQHIDIIGIPHIEMDVLNYF